MGYFRGQMIAIGVIFMVLPTFIVGLRIWAKTMSRRGLAWDDYLIFLALVRGTSYLRLYHLRLYQGATVAACSVQIAGQSTVSAFTSYTSLTRYRVAATDGQLGQHQTDHPNGMPILDDPRFLLYERVGISFGCTKQCAD